MQASSHQWVQLANVAGVDAEGKPTCRPAVDCPGGTTWSEIDPKKCVPLPRWTGEGRWRDTPTKPLWEHVCAALGNIPWVGNNAAKLCEQQLK